MEASSPEHMVIECPLLRKCNICGEHKPQTDFYKLAPPKRAKQDILGNRRISRCRSCEMDKYANLDAKTKILYAARARAKKLGVECTITKDDILIPDACPECQHELMDSNPSVCLTSWPPQYMVHCPNCGYTGSRY